jgi:hypothetical protein
MSLHLLAKEKALTKKIEADLAVKMEERLKNAREEESKITNFLREGIMNDSAESRRRYLEYLHQEKYFEEAENVRTCPFCSRMIEKIDGCRSVVCGRDYHGGNIQSGCGKSFDFYTAPRYKSKVQDINNMIQKLQFYVSMQR